MVRRLPGPITRYKIIQATQKICSFQTSNSSSPKIDLLKKLIIIMADIRKFYNYQIIELCNCQMIYFFGTIPNFIYLVLFLFIYVKFIMSSSTQHEWAVPQIFHYHIRVEQSKLSFSYSELLNPFSIN